MHPETCAESGARLANLHSGIHEQKLRKARLPTRGTCGARPGNTEKTIECVISYTRATVPENGSNSWLSRHLGTICVYMNKNRKCKWDKCANGKEKLFCHPHLVFAEFELDLEEEGK